MYRYYILVTLKCFSPPPFRLQTQELLENQALKVEARVREELALSYQGEQMSFFIPLS